MGREAFASIVPSGSEDSFSDTMAKLLDRIDFRLANSDEERKAIFRLRYQAYLRDGMISPDPSEAFSDAYDEIGNVYLLGAYIDGDLASSIRLHVASSKHPEFPSFEAFADILQPELDAGKVIIDATRFAADEKYSRLYRGLPYATLRLCMLAARNFGADLLLAAVGAEQRLFYERSLDYRLMSDARPYPLLAKPISLMSLHYQTAADRLNRRYGFFRSTLSERRTLFAQPTAGRFAA